MQSVFLKRTLSFRRILPQSKAILNNVGRRACLSTLTTEGKPARSKALFASVGVALAVGMAGYSFSSAKTEAVVYTDAKAKNNDAFIESLKGVVGQSNVIVHRTKAEPYVRGIRLGHGEAQAVILPNSLKEAISVLQICVDQGVAIIMQGSNTGLTGGSVPRDDAGREFVILSMSRLKKIMPIHDRDENNKEVDHVLCYSGSGLFDLQKTLNAFGRSPHSLLGSIFLNPSIGGGVSFGSGGTQLRKGPVYTERTLYCKVDANGKVQIINNLGFKGNPEIDELLTLLDQNDILYEDQFSTSAKAHDDTYKYRVCKLNDDVSRYNADISGSSECVRSEGKVMILATIHDTFPIPKEKSVYWISCSSFQQITQLKKDVVLSDPLDLPPSCEYMNQDTYEVVEAAGRPLIALINIAGMKWLGQLWKIKDKFEALPFVPRDFTDRLLYITNNIFPSMLPKDCQEMGKKHSHHMILEIGEFGNGELKRVEERLHQHLKNNPDIQIYKCKTNKEISSVMNFRFAVAAAFKTYNTGKGYLGLSLDYAMRKNDFEIPLLFPKQELYLESPTNPSNHDDSHVLAPIRRLRYMHFGCNVVHEDISFAKLDSTHNNEPTDIHPIKLYIKAILEARQIRLPAEHGHGTEYCAPKETQARWMKIDPTNTLNPGVGGTKCSEYYK